MSEKEIDLDTNIAAAEEASGGDIIGSSSANKPETKKKSSLKSSDNSVVSSKKASAAPKKTAKPKAAKPKDETVAIYSERNVNWRDVGSISKGYNIVSKEKASKWLTRPYIREATPEEVAREFGV